jgi:hypothetical protein
MMLRNYKRLVAVAGALAAAGTLAVTSVAAASVSPGQGSAVAGTEHFQLVTASASATTGVVIAYGVFTGRAVDHMGNSIDKFVFAGGSFKVFHSQGSGPVSLNSRTCLLSGSIQGTFRVYGGTGSFKHISGHGKYQATILSIQARSNGHCSQTKLPLAFEQTIRAAGRVTR